MKTRQQIATATLLLLVALLLGGCAVPADLMPRMLATQVAQHATPTATPALVAQAAVAQRGQPTRLPQGSAEDLTTLYDAVEAMTIQVYERVSPSVVHITSRVITMGYFGLYPSEGTGSGFVIDKQGHIVTNYHVIEGAQTIEVSLLGDTVVEAEVVGVDPQNDLAVLRVDVEADKLYPVDLSFDGQLRVGQRALAIGNPFGLDRTLTTGVISSLGRPLQVSREHTIYDTIQTDAAINPGNSGGPLLNSRGQLIGVNTAIKAQGQNIGFAVPIATVRRVVPELIANGRYRHPWLGITGYSLFPELARRLQLPVERGLLIARVYRESPAARAGLHGARSEVILGNYRLMVGGDIIVAINGLPVEGSESLREILETKTRVGQEAEVAFYRGDKLMTTRVLLAEAPR